MVPKYGFDVLAHRLGNRRPFFGEFGDHLAVPCEVNLLVLLKLT
jgi:hypothetical protein